MAGFMILLLLGANIALAQHSTVHFTPEGHPGIHHGHDHEHHGDHDHGEHNGPQYVGFCQICFFSKGFSWIKPAEIVVFPVPVYETGFSSFVLKELRKGRAAPVYLARAPPVFSF